MSTVSPTQIPTDTPHRARTASLVISILLCAGFCLLLTVKLLFRFAKRNSGRSVYIAVGSAWYASFTLLYLLPIDLVAEHSALRPVFALIYWISFVATWAVLPLMQSYVMSGFFTTRGKIKSSMKENAIFYGILLGLFVVFVIILVSSKAVNWADMFPFLAMIANTWGLTLMTLLLGYGLVEVPRKLWHYGDRKYRLSYLFYKACSVHDDLVEARERMRDSLHMYSLAKRRTPAAYAKELGMMESALPLDPDIQSDDRRPSAVPAFDQKLLDTLLDGDVALSTLARLHYRLKQDSWEIERVNDQWQRLVKTIDRLEFLLSTHANEQPPPWREGCVEFFGWRFRMYIKPRLVQSLAIVCAILSLVIVWCEVTVASNTLSILGHIRSAVDLHPVLLIFTCLFFLVYIAGCSFFTLFRVRLLKYYHMHPGQGSDPNSILFNAAYILRVVFPMGVNYLNMINVKHENSAFMQAMGNYNFMDEWINRVLPALIAVFGIATLFNVYGRVLRFLHISRFEYNAHGESASSEGEAEGKLLVRRERRKMQRRGELDVRMSNAHEDIEKDVHAISMDVRDSSPQKSRSFLPKSWKFKRSQPTQPSNEHLESMQRSLVENRLDDSLQEYDYNDVSGLK